VALIHFRELVKALSRLELDSHSRLIAHAAPGSVRILAGGDESLVAAVMAVTETVCMPAFTLRAAIVPPFGPEDNGLVYGEDDAANLDSEIFTHDLPADAELGEIGELFRKHPETVRSDHPLLSFSTRGAPECLERQSLDEPLAPIGWMAEFDADVLLIGVDHRANVALHWAEQLAGRKTFVRWALTEKGVVTCARMPGCSQGFNAIEERLGGVVRRTVIGPLTMEAIALRDLVNIASAWIREDPRALLCDRPSCLACAAVRKDVRQPDTSGHDLPGAAGNS
jgi:aminoglycoside 3-N-acetyltransferase